MYNKVIPQAIRRAVNKENIMQASIATSNKGQTIIYTTDTMGMVSFKAMQHRNGEKECFVMREDEGQWKAYGIENFETIIQLAKYQIK